MNYYGGKELAAAFRTVRNNTITVATEIPEEKYDFKASPDTRGIREALVHIALGTFFADHVHRNRVNDFAKVNFQELMAAFNAEQAKPRSKADVIAFLQTEGDRFASYVEGLADPLPAEVVKM